MDGSDGLSMDKCGADEIFLFCWGVDRKRTNRKVDREEGKKSEGGHKKTMPQVETGWSYNFPVCSSSLPVDPLFCFVLFMSMFLF